MSCLRCHSTPDTRARDPAFVGRGAVRVGGRGFLGNLTDDHPLARYGRGGNAPPMGRAWATTHGITRRLAVPFSADVEPSPPECTTCHVVHSAPDPALAEDGQREICLSCHDPARYVDHHVGVACTACHAMHGGSEHAQLRGLTVDGLCSSCHGVTAAASGPSELASYLSLQQWRGVAPRLLERSEHSRDAGAAGDDCLSCHEFHR